MLVAHLRHLWGVTLYACVKVANLLPDRTAGPMGRQATLPASCFTVGSNPPNSTGNPPCFTGSPLDTKQLSF